MVGEGIFIFFGIVVFRGYNLFDRCVLVVFVRVGVRNCVRGWVYEVLKNGFEDSKVWETNR